MAEEPDPRALRVVLVDPQPERPQVMRHVVERSALAATAIAEADNKAGAVELLERSDAELEGADYSCVQCSWGFRRSPSLRSSG